MSMGDQEAFDRFWRDADGGPKAPKAPARSVERGVPEIIAAGIGVITLIGMVVLWPTGKERPDLSEAGVPSQFYRATVTTVDERPCDFDATQTCATATFELTEGPNAGDSIDQELTVNASTPSLAAGDRVVLSYAPESEPEFEYQYSDRERRPVLLVLTIVFVVAVLALGARRGAGALAGLAGSFVILGLFVLPALIDGRPPLPVAVVGASAIAYLALYAAHGFGRTTTLALLGTLAALALTALLSTLVVAAARYSGFASEESFFLTVMAAKVDFRGLVLAGLVLGALGALDDVTVTQASAVDELRAANRALSSRELFTAGMRIGRDHVASTVNTLFLAYAGAALPLLMLFVLASQSLGDVANGEVVAVEITRALVGSIGLVAAVPVTTVLAAWLGRAPKLEEAG
jgi:uncharacterized membrane protein